MAKILVVEDNPDNMCLVEWILDDAAHDHFGVMSGEECLKVLTQKQFDLILMDIALPGIDGKETTREIRNNDTFSQCKEIPIIALTAHAIKTEEDEIWNAGVNDLVTKPLNEDNLIERISLLLNSS